MSKILVVDDEELILNIIQSYLRKEGDVITFNNPESILQYLKQNSADIIICDYFMPEMTGEELVKELRNQGNNIPVILMSGSHVKSEQILNFTDYIKKPFRPAEIQNIVKSVLKEFKN